MFGVDQMKRPGSAECLADWAKGKPIGLEAVCLQAVSAASACHELLELNRLKKGPLWRLSEPDEDVWFELYCSHRAVRAGVLSAVGATAEQVADWTFILDVMNWCSNADPSIVKSEISKSLLGVTWESFVGNIQQGLESIEAVAGSIFSDLMQLDHAVVFFDECDELFRDRKLTEEGSRNILSFATASMLPKLQKLHDTRKVLFILGTNYVRNIDTAIRRPGRFDAVLLFDRPDRNARLAVATDIIASAKGGAGVSAEEIANESDGWMIEQLMAHTRGKLAGKAYPTPSTTDYCEWCRDDGQKELAAAGVPKQTTKNVLARWAPHMERAENESPSVS